MTSETEPNPLEQMLIAKQGLSPEEAREKLKEAAQAIDDVKDRNTIRQHGLSLNQLRRMRPDIRTFNFDLDIPSPQLDEPATRTGPLFLEPKQRNSYNPYKKPRRKYKVNGEPL